MPKGVGRQQGLSKVLSSNIFINQYQTEVDIYSIFFVVAEFIVKLQENGLGHTESLQIREQSFISSSEELA